MMPLREGDRNIFSAESLRSDRVWVLSVFVVALVLRLAILGVTFRGNDAVYYYDDAQIALNLIEGKGYSVSYQYRNWLLYEALLKGAKLDNPVVDGTRATALKQPANALLIAALFYCFGPKNFLIVFVINAVFSALTVSLLFLCLRPNVPVTALLAALGAAIYPPFAFHAVTVPESTAPLLFLIAA